jgi:hypothetical protein
MAVVMSQLSPALPLFAQRGAFFHWSAREENFLVSPRYQSSAGFSIHGKSRWRGTGRLRRRLTWMRKPHIILIDEVGYEELTREQANLFFQVVNARYEHGSIILTTNKPFGRWAEVLNDEAIATATLDRLLHHAHVFSIKGDSYRMKDRMKIGVVDPV